jgi:outer membrane protein OmpA-like peptidoglycan-associated protein
MKKNIFISMALLALAACAPREYSDLHHNMYYDDVINEENVVRNTLVRHQEVDNYYHVNEVKENHYYLNGSNNVCCYYYPHYSRYRPYYRHYYPTRRIVYVNRPTTVVRYVNQERDNAFYKQEHTTNNYSKYTNIGNYENKWYFYFQLNSDRLTEKEEIGHLIDYAKSHTNMSFYIDSYADANTGTYEYNMDLSERRAKTIINILINEGISGSRLFVRNHGSSSQNYNTNNLNRHVVVKAVVK